MKQEIIKENVAHFCLHKEDFYYNTLDYEILCNNEVLFKAEESLQPIYENNDFIFTNTLYGHGITYDLLNKNLKYFENQMIKFVDSDVLISTINKKGQIHINKINNDIDLSFRFMMYIMDKKNNRFICYEGNHRYEENHRIHIIELDKNGYHFTFDLIELGTYPKIYGDESSQPLTYKLNQFSGIYENTLVCTLTKSLILLLDLNTAQPIKILEHGIRTYLQPTEIEYIYQGIDFRTFLELNVLEQKITRKSDLSNAWEYIEGTQGHETFGLVKYSNQYFYYTRNDRIVGIFDPVTEKVINEHQFHFDRKKHQQLRSSPDFYVKEGSMYCLDSLGNVYKITPESD